MPAARAGGRTGVERLCFGTSTFVAGRLRPGKDSRPGMAALRCALDAGVRTVHSNPRLETQWAVRRVLDEMHDAPPVRHLIKAEAPLGVNAGVVGARIVEALELSLRRLGVDRIHALVLEIDVKRTQDTGLLGDADRAEEFYAVGAEIAAVTGVVDTVSAYCHRYEHVTGALRCPQVSGVAAQYSLNHRWSAACVGEVTDTGRRFIGMSPLDRGRLLGTTIPGWSGSLPALEWALADQRVSALAITTSNVQHLRDVIHAFEDSAAITRRHSVALPELMTDIH